MSRTIAIGDIHGCADEMKGLIERLCPKPDDHLVFLGDYVDRGPDSYGVIEYLLALQDRCICTFLRGNHEDMMLMAIYTEQHRNDPSQELLKVWLYNGGQKALDSYRRARLSASDKAESDLFQGVRIPHTHGYFLAQTKLVLEKTIGEESFVFVHAGFLPDKSLARQLAAVPVNPDLDTLLWNRTHIEFLGKHPDNELPWERTVVCGHTPRPRPIVRKNLLMIDTGACMPHWNGRKGYLTAVILPERTFVTSAPDGLVPEPDLFAARHMPRT
jgi:serine/threonine protein phosphatase 1